MASSSSLTPLRVAAIIAAALVVIVALPASVKQGWAPSWLNPGFHLGLDLAGGTQLDFRISENEIDQQQTEVAKQIKELEQSGAAGTQLDQLRNEQQVIADQRANLVEAIRTVLERRINSLGVSEATITPSYVGGEKHLLVECPGVVDVQKCIATVGKTIQLEFKEEFTEASKEYENSVRAKVTAALAKVRNSGATLAVLGQDIGSQLGMGYKESQAFYKDQLPKGLESIWDAPVGNAILQKEGTVTSAGQDDKGQPVQNEISGVFLLQVLKGRTPTERVVNEAPKAFGILATKEPNVKQRYEDNKPLDATVPPAIAGALRGMKGGDLKTVTMTDGSAQLLFLRSFVPGQQQVDVSHILISYKGAQAAEANVTRTKEQALTRAKDLKAQLAKGANFDQLARAQSDGPSKANGGSLGPISHGSLVPSFEQVAFSAPVGQISEPVETPFGYHLIRVNKAAAMTPDHATFDALTVTGTDSAKRAEDFLARLQAGTVTTTEDAVTLRTLFFSLQPTGWKDTALDGKHFRSASVTLNSSTGLPEVQIIFDDQGAKLFQEITKSNIGKRIAIFVGGELVTAPTVQAEISGGTAVITGSYTIDEAKLLAQDLNTGAIPAPIHLSGQRTVEATLGAQALSMSVLAGLIGILIVMAYMIIMYRFLGVLANIALIIYATFFIAILKLPLLLVTNQYIVLTLAGAAGMILSIGMAVDCNVLVFERVKEELKRGKMLKTAVEIGFEKAWPSVRDSNISTIITCVLLFMIGTSIVRGFAVTLGMGVIISMFTGMIITRAMARYVATTKIANNPKLFPGSHASHQQ